MSPAIPGEMSSVFAGASNRHDAAAAARKFNTRHFDNNPSWDPGARHRQHGYSEEKS